MLESILPAAHLTTDNAGNTWCRVRGGLPRMLLPGEVRTTDEWLGCASVVAIPTATKNATLAYRLWRRGHRVLLFDGTSRTAVLPMVSLLQAGPPYRELDRDLSILFLAYDTDKRVSVRDHPMWEYLAFFAGWDEPALREICRRVGHPRWFRSCREWLLFLGVGSSRHLKLADAEPTGRHAAGRRTLLRMIAEKLQPTLDVDRRKGARKLAVLLYYAWRQALWTGSDPILVPALCCDEKLASDYEIYVRKIAHQKKRTDA